MGLLDEFLREYKQEESSANSLSPLSAEEGLTKVTGSQDIENVHKKTILDARRDGRSFKHECWGPRKTRCPSNKLRDGSNNVAFVACVREDESAKFPLFSKGTSPYEPSPVSSLARASAKGDKLDCESCPACGHWDGYGRMGPGRYCFFSAVFKCKAARPVPIAEAQKACEKMDIAENV